MKTISLFAGPGGADAGAALLGLDVHGWDLDADACATAAAAGYARTRASVTDLDPESMRGVTGAVITPPCPTFSAAGRRTGRDDMPRILDALTLLGNSQATHVGADAAWRAAAASVQDPRSALVTEALRFALRLPHLQWLVCEQVPAAGRIWQEIGAELAAVGDFDHAVVVTVAAEDLGVASRRARTFLLASRHWPPVLDGLPIRSGWVTGRWAPPAELVPQTGAAFSTPSMADVLGWPAGERVNTRGNRKTSGGNEFSADGPSWCLTEKARTWQRVSDGARLTTAEAGLLVGFPSDYPWQGSRSRQFLQAADVVAPPVAAAVIGACLGLDWQAPVRDYLAGIYPAAALTAPAARQQTLWEAAA
ncbi:DNA cytosine methyltransferase [Glycomyces sp. NPDC021274]|uniref:DNA cytosine methyltransferase n=1 Tax=Glycomyces sp. NPDC021274 TaxID=3155120 RepID=UPI0033FBAC48